MTIAGAIFVYLTDGAPVNGIPRTGGALLLSL